MEIYPPSTTRATKLWRALSTESPAPKIPTDLSEHSGVNVGSCPPHSASRADVAFFASVTFG